MKKLMMIGCTFAAGLALAGTCPCRDFGKLSDGRETKLWRIQGVGGLILDVTDYGGRVVRCYAPDRHGNLADVTLGWNTAADGSGTAYADGATVKLAQNITLYAQWKMAEEGETTYTVKHVLETFESGKYYDEPYLVEHLCKLEFNAGIDFADLVRKSSGPVFHLIL